MVNEEKTLEKVKELNAEEQHDVKKRSLLYPASIGLASGLLGLIILNLVPASYSAGALIIGGISLLPVLLPLVFTMIGFGIYIRYQQKSLNRKWDEAFDEDQEEFLEENGIGRDYVVTRRHYLITLISSLLFGLF